MLREAISLRDLGPREAALMATSTKIDTRKVEGRRKLHFNNVEEILADAEEMAACDSKTIGNWSQGQIYRHVGETMNQCIDGMDFNPPWFIKAVGRLLKKRFLTKPMMPGYQLPKSTKLLPPEISDEDGLQYLRDAVARLQNESKRSDSPLLGKMTNDDWTLLHCRHCEHHLSYIVKS